MIRALHSIEMGGEKVEMLFTPSLYSIAKRKGVIVSCEDTSDFAQVMEAYTKIMYLAALNAWEVRLFDDPSLGDFPYCLMDFSEWAAQDQKGFVRVMMLAVEALTGKPMGDGAKEEVKKK